MPKKVSGDPLLDAIEDLAESLDLGHPQGTGLGFTFDQISLIDAIITAGRDSDWFFDSKEAGW